MHDQSAKLRRVDPAILMDINSVPVLPSHRRFGLIFAAIFAAIGLVALIKDKNVLTAIAPLIVSVFFGLTAAFIPKALSPLNLIWFRFGELLGKIVSPIVMGILFFGIIAPISLASRLLGRDELRLRRQPLDSYWIKRPLSGLMAESFKNQF
jgi:hypothetical protein